MKRSEIRGILDSATLHPGYELRAASCELSDLLHNEELIGGKPQTVAPAPRLDYSPAWQSLRTSSPPQGWLPLPRVGNFGDSADLPSILLEDRPS